VTRIEKLFIGESIFLSVRVSREITGREGWMIAPPHQDDNRLTTMNDEIINEMREE
jgi:hypothetical protein